MVRGSGGWLRESLGSPEPSSFDAEAADIANRFRLQLIGLRRRFKIWEMPAVMRSLQQQRDMELTALRDRHVAARFGDQARQKAERAARRLSPRPDE